MRKNPVKENDSLRPVGARPLKSVGDTLRPYLHESVVLDIYAGLGRFGLMAAKEGAKEVTFIEKNPKTLEAVKAEASRPTLKHCSFHFHKRAAFDYLDTAGNMSFDLVFCDPPFEDWKNTFGDELLTRLAKVLKMRSILLVKHPERVVLSSPVPKLQLWKSTVFGESAFTYFVYGEENGSSKSETENP